MDNLTIEIVNKEALTLLKGMERLNLIRIFRKTKPEKVHWAQKYRGAMSRQPVEEIDRQLNELRDAWE